MYMKFEKKGFSGQLGEILHIGKRFLSKMEVIYFKVSKKFLKRFK